MSDMPSYLRVVPAIAPSPALDTDSGGIPFETATERRPTGAFGALFCHYVLSGDLGPTAKRARVQIPDES
jgi:hypothetical protein